MNKDFTQAEIELLKKAVSYLSANRPDAEEAFDETIEAEALAQLEDKLYKE